MAKRKKKTGKTVSRSIGSDGRRASRPADSKSKSHRIQPKAAGPKSKRNQPKVRRTEPVSKSRPVRNRPRPSKTHPRRRKSPVSPSRSQAAKRGWETRRRNLEGTPQEKLIAEIKLLRHEKKSRRFEQRLEELAKQITDMRREALRQGRREGVKHAIQEGQKAFREFQHREIKRYLQERGRLNKQGKIRKRKPLRRWWDPEMEQWETYPDAIPMWEIEDFLAETGIDDREFWSYYRGLS